MEEGLQPPASAAVGAPSGAGDVEMKETEEERDELGTIVGPNEVFVPVQLVKAEEQQTTDSASSERLPPGTQVTRPIVWGSVAKFMGEQAIKEDATHTWCCYVRGLDPGEDLGTWVKSVTFTLHESFDSPVRVATKAPFCMTELGWGEFEVKIEVRFVDEMELPVVFSHMLKLYESAPVIFDHKLGPSPAASKPPASPGGVKSPGDGSGASDVGGAGSAGGASHPPASESSAESAPRTPEVTRLKAHAAGINSDALHYEPKRLLPPVDGMSELLKPSVSPVVSERCDEIVFNQPRPVLAEAIAEAARNPRFFFSPQAPGGVEARGRPAPYDSMAKYKGKSRLLFHAGSDDAALKATVEAQMRVKLYLSRLHHRSVAIEEETAQLKALLARQQEARDHEAQQQAAGENSARRNRPAAQSNFNGLPFPQLLNL